ncbi:MAG: ABC transporter permease subunit [Bacillota bacterium]
MSVPGTESPSSANLRSRISRAVDSFGLPRLTVTLFLVFLFVLGTVKGVPVDNLITNSLSRFGMNAVMVLSMVPAIQSGIGPNFGLPLGLISGLIGLVTALELRLTGMGGLLAALGMGTFLGALAGVGYGYLLNRVKGQEMMVGTYVGFAAVSGMCVFWLLMPFTNPQLLWPLGGLGLRVTISLGDYFSNLLDKLWQFKLGKVVVPTGLLVTVGLVAGAYKLFTMTRLGTSMDLAGQSEQFAGAAGVNVPRMRITGTAISTALAAFGIVLYAHTYGFVQLYVAPLMMAFPAVASILIGGATPRSATISNALIGTLLFQTLLVITVPVTQSVVSGDISEAVRLIVSNGMVLYALTRGQGGGGNGG